MIDKLNLVEVAKKLGKNQRLIIKSLIASPLPINNFSSVKSIVSNLQDRGLVVIKDNQLHLSVLGQEAWNILQKEASNNQNYIQNKLSKRELLSQEKLARSNELLKFYTKGLSYQDIGDKYGLSRERVRQILKINPAFHEYIKEREEAEAAAELVKAAVEREKAEQAKQELYLRSLAVLYPERVAQLWDYEKNGELKPEEVFAGSSIQYIWLKCPVDGHSWKKKPNDITNSWDRYGTSGCPVCVGRTKKAEKQPKLLEVYPEFVSQYWDYQKNSELGLDPAKLTLGSNKKVWFKCPHDGNEWEAIIASTITQQWSKENAGCRVCNGTDERKRGKWKPRDPIAVEFPDEVARYWNYEKNHELKIDPMKVTIGSSKKAWFKCPIDGHEWQATITAIAKTSWKRGNSGCPACNGKIATEYTSLAALYPDYVAQYWDYEKNRQLGLDPYELTKGTSQSAWFKCPIDRHEWKTQIASITRGSWRLGNSGCPRCGSGWTLEAIRQFVASLEEHIPNLTQAERYKIFEQSIDLIVVDEIHRCRQRGDDPSKRRQMVMALITNATEKNPNLHVLGMSATPVINNLKEGKSLVELVTGVERSDLSEKATLDNCMRLHQAFVTLGIRSRVKPKITINRKRIPIDCTHLVDEIREKGTSVLKMEQILTRARIPEILKELRPKTIIYTHYVEGIVEQLKEAVEAAGWTVGFHIGGDKSGRNSFIDGSTDILIASSAMAVGVDGFQKICDRLILNIPPWTSAELEQLEGRLNRQGQVHDTLTIIMPVTYGFDDGEQWSWDEGRLARLQNKQTIADAAVDGVMPEGKLRTESQAFRDLRGWLDRLKTGEQKSVVRPRIFAPLPDINPVDVQRRNVQYGDFSRMNARWNNSYSHTTYQRLQENPEEWMQYHTLYQEARKTWNIIPYEEAIKWLQKRSDLVVADFGCGEALLAKALAGRHTIHSFDFIAINESVIECDMAHLPLEDGCLDVAMFNLSLMGLNIGDYIREAARTLKLDGQLWIYEVASHFKNIQQFVYALELAGFKIIDNLEMWKFRHIRAIKSEEVDLTQFHVSL